MTKARGSSDGQRSKPIRATPIMKPPAQLTTRVPKGKPCQSEFIHMPAAQRSTAPMAAPSATASIVAQGRW